ncbi:class I SAM-dependent methyltransferase [Pontibacillus salicampi]|uniref:Class I SAM-dependent methyltransferase n=1 Tax=Pontibacillus salicampi TaxID=1449801 RepID=A0ABV6LIE0_9BACI
MSHLEYDYNVDEDVRDSQPVPERVFHLLENYISLNQSSILELESGRGTITKAFEHHHAHLLAIHHSNADILRARSMNPNVTFVKGTAEYLPFEKDYFDLVYCNHHWQQLDRNKVLSEVERVLKPHGYLLILDAICREHSSEIVTQTNRLVSRYTHFHPYNAYEQANKDVSSRNVWAMEWKKAGFTVVEMEEISFQMVTHLQKWIDITLDQYSYLRDEDKHSLEGLLKDYLEPYMVNGRTTIPYQCTVTLLRSQ